MWRGVAVDEVTSGMGKKPMGFTGLGFFWEGDCWPVVEISHFLVRFFFC